MTAGRDASIRVWDIRTKNKIFLLTGHDSTVNHIEAQAYDPQLISSSSDSTVKLWDLTAGKCRVTLTNHKKSVRALAIHPTEYTFATGSSDNIK
jgi:pleiotropic regulator 1